MVVAGHDEVADADLRAVGEGDLTLRGTWPVVMRWWRARALRSATVWESAASIRLVRPAAVSVRQASKSRSSMSSRLPASTRPCSEVGVGGGRLAVAQVEGCVAFPLVPEPANVVQGGGVRPVGGEELERSSGLDG